MNANDFFLVSRDRHEGKLPLTFAALQFRTSGFFSPAPLPHARVLADVTPR